jgi:hypothetical protein
MTDATSSPASLASVPACEARVRHFGESHRREVVLRSGHSMPAYVRLLDEAVTDLTGEAHRGESAATIAYASTFLAERRRLTRDAVAIEQLGPLPVEPVPDTPVEEEADAVVESAAVAPAAESPSPGEVATAPAAPRTPEIPSYLRGAAQLQQPADISISAPAAMPPQVTQDVDATMPPFARFDPILPFEDAPPGVALAKAVADGDGETRMAPADGSDETAYLMPAAISGPATPFDREGDGSLNLAAYARFLGELSASPGDAAALRAKHGIASEADQLALGQKFSESFARDPKLRMRLEILVAQARTRAAGAK